MFTKGHRHSEATKRKIGDANRRLVYFECDYCGDEATTKPSAFARKRRHYCSMYCYAKDREENWRPHEQNTWKGGITKQTQVGRGTKKYRQWQRAVFERDNFTCIWCDSTEQLEADHIKRWSTHPKLRYIVDNGRTLCRLCHDTIR